MSTRRRKTDEPKVSRDNHEKNDDRHWNKNAKEDSFLPHPYVSVFLILVGSASLITCVLHLTGHIELFSPNTNVPFGEPLNLTYPEKKWGSLRPGIYFGLKSMSPESLASGLVWFQNRLESNSIPIRHECNQWDRLPFYSWLKHDFDSFGVQKITDNGVDIETSFVIHDEDSWSTVIRTSLLNSSKFDPDLPLSLVYYTALGQDSFKRPRNDTIDAVDAEFPLPPEKDFIIKGWTKGTDYFQLRIRIEDGEGTVLFRSFTGAKLTPSLLHVREAILQNLGIIHDDKNPKYPNLFVLRGEPVKPEYDNIIAHQVLVRGPVTLRIDYAQGESETSAAEKVVELQDLELDPIFQRKHSKFEEDFDRSFRLKRKGFSEERVKFGQTIYSSLVGGIGHFYGLSKVAAGKSDKILPYGPFSLLSAVPSRPAFPRGFLWDEGFHQLLISRSYPSLSVNIIKSWMSLMNKDGWIPREVILGPEAESRVPAEFIVQRDSNGNPPTLFLTFESLLDEGSLHFDDLKDLFPRLQAWFAWFNQTQLGPKEGTYTWRGRDPNAKELNPKTLTSGLDDFPRATHPDSTEYHVDLRCWMALAARVMTRISRLLRHESYEEYDSTAKFLSANDLLDSLHWSEEHQMYCDFGLHSKRVRLVKKVVDDKEVVEREVLDPPTFSCVPELGYVGLYPLLLQILEPSNPRLGVVLDNLVDPKLFWTNYGLRSISTTSFYYRKYNTLQDAPYWRGNIWINLNYLALKALHSYGEKDGPYQTKARDVYSRLRKNLIDNMFKEYKRTGFIWETYEDDTGRGHGSHPFTGWSALVVLIMAEKY